MPFDGLLVVDKPRGPTSHDVVAGARRHFATREVGHAGTLDPMATGVLVLLFGEARKLSGYLTLDTKTYVAEVTFGSTTDTLDAEGKVTLEAPLTPDTLSPERIEAALASERERTLQTPPVVSSIKVGGERAHRLTRRGAPPALEPRAVRVERLTLLTASENRLSLEVTASKGYYVRALARDLGETLGAPAHLSALARTRSGSFTLDDAVSWPPGDAARLMSLTEAARRALPVAVLNETGVFRARRGQPLEPEHFDTAPGTPAAHAWLDAEGRAIALGERADDGYRVLRGFRD
jgi:tRNA pseudouridine55 synthase